MLQEAKEYDPQDPLVEEIQSLLGSFEVKYNSAALYLFLMTRFIRELNKKNIYDASFAIDDTWVNLKLSQQSEETMDETINKENLIGVVLSEGITDEDILRNVLRVGKIITPELIMIAKTCENILDVSTTLKQRQLDLILNGLNNND